MSVTGDGGDGATRRNLPYAVIIEIRNEEIAGSIHGRSIGNVQSGGGRRSVVAGVRSLAALRVLGAVARDGRDGAAGPDLTDSIVVEIRDKEIAGGAQGDSNGEVQ